MTTTERALIAVWSEVLELDDVGADDTFIELGGDSISATLCVNRVHTTFGITLDVGVLLVEAVTLRQLADRVDQSVRQAAV